MVSDSKTHKKSVPHSIDLASLSTLTLGLLTALPVFSAPPNFDAGALLEQLNRQTVPKPVNPLLPADTKPRELLTSFEFRELPERLVPVASDFLRPYVGKEVRMSSLMMSLYAHLQERNARDNFIFTPKKVGTGYVLIAQKVVFDGVTIEANATRSEDKFLAGLMGHKLEPLGPLDYAQIERNATVISELPGIVSQFNMKPGAAPGSSNVHLSTDQGAFYAGSATEDNSGTRTLGVWTTRADIAAYNHFGLADIIRVNGQLTLNSQSLGLDASAIVHPSGLRSGLNLSTFQYGYRSETDGTIAGNPQHTNSHFTGVSNSTGWNFTYPHVRTDEERQNFTLDLNYNTTVSDVDITQQTRIVGTTPEQVNNSSAAYRLSDLLIRKATLGVNGARALGTGATVNYQLAGVLGNATQRLASAEAQDNSGEHTLGGFAKVTAAVQYTQGFKLAGVSYDGLLTGELQFTHRNLAGPEKAYLGGIYKMQGWGPQAVGGPQVAYVKAQITRPVSSVPGMAIGAFAEWAHLQLSHRDYNTSVGAQTVPVGTGWQSLSDVGLMLTHAPRANVTLSAALAKKLGSDPVVNGSRIQDDSSLRGWVSARITF
jgi:hemolysin activation/secretion protein